MIAFINSCGALGIAILAVTIFLLVVGLRMVWTANSPLPGVVFAVLASLPLLLGLVGTAAGYVQIQAAVDEHGIPAAAAEDAKALGWNTTYLGGGATAALWLIVLGASVARGAGGQQPAGYDVEEQVG